ncbi:hypothetical protein ACIP9X_08955 [Arthrobacter sp. NPDC093125]|uniref:hypothetical protein n=1 Tax=Arthrobacter sp. NPDC093125 TaxID=3363944 RepID=UPI0038141D01
MKRWSVLSIPLIGLAGFGIWAQSLAAAPASQPNGVVVVDPASSSTSSTTAPGSAPGPAPTSSAPAPDRFRSAEAPRRLDMAQPQTTEQAETQDADGDSGVVQRVAPTQVTSPAVAAPDGSASAVPDDKDVPDDNGGSDDGRSDGSGPDGSGPDGSGPDDSEPAGQAGLAENGGGTDD